MKKIYFLITFLSLIVGGVIAQNNSETINKIFAKATNDSSSIAVNKRAGWESVISHLTPMKSDSVLLELVVRHDRTSIDWKQEQVVGRIKLKNLLPVTEQTIMFKFIRSVYRLRIQTNGRCYLRLETGTLPPSDPVVVRIRATYKKC